MKKTIKNLNIRDLVYSQTKDEYPIEWKVILLTETKMEVHSNNIGIRIASRNDADLTAFKFIGDIERPSSDYYKTTFYTEKLDALKSYRKKLDDRIEAEYKAQKDFLEKIMNLVNKARVVDEEIVKELRS